MAFGQKRRRFYQISFCTHNSSLQSATKLKFAPIYSCSLNALSNGIIFAEIKFFIFWPKTMDYNPWFNFGLILAVREKFGQKDPIGKGISRGAQWCKFKIRSTFQRRVMSVQACVFFFFNRCCDDLYHACTFEWEISNGTHNSSLEGAMKLKFVPFCCR